MDNEELMRNTKVSKAVATMAVPSVVSSLVTIVYNMADTFFVGQTGDALQVAAVSLTNPIFILLMACANMFGVGGSVLLARSLGEGRKERAKHVSAFVVYAALAVGLLVCLILLVGMRPVLTLFGADAETYAFAKGYTTNIAWGAPFIVASAASSNLVRGEGSSRDAMAGNMIGTFSNIILDPVFISVLGLGAAGAAMATSVGNILACTYYLIYFLKKAENLSLSPKDFTCRDGIMRGVCTTGFPTAIFSALMSVSTIVINQMLVVYGNAPVAAIGIVFKANMFITFLQQGVANGVQPLLSYSYGAKNYERFLDIQRFTRRCVVIVGVSATILYFVLREPIIRLFIDDDEVVYYGVRMLLAYMLAGPFIGLLFVNMNSMQSVGRALPATLLSVTRQGILLIPLLFLLRAAAGLNGIIYAQSISDITTVILSVLIWHSLRRKVITEPMARAKRQGQPADPDREEK